LTSDATSPLAVHFSSEISFNSESAASYLRILSMSSQPNDQGRQFRVQLTQDPHEVQYRLVPTGITYDPPAIPIDDRQVRVGNLQRRQFRVGIDLGGGDEHSIS
jgi:hypothetical protein